MSKLKLARHPIYTDYMISECGRVFRVTEIKPQTNRNGYYRMSWKGGGSKQPRKYLMIHKLVMEAHHGCPIPEGKQVDHVDRNRKNNCIDNLRIVSAVENCMNRSTSKTKTGEEEIPF